MNPNQDIPQTGAPGISEPLPVQPGSGLSSAPEEKFTHSQSVPDAVPADVTNLAVGAGLLLSAFLIFWMALYLPNQVALRTLVASFGTFALVWVLYRLRVFHRPHGGLIVAGAVALFAAALPFIERGFQKLDHAAKSGLADESAKTATLAGESAQGLPVPTQQNNPGLPPPTAPATLPPPAPPEDDTVHDLIAPAPDPSIGKIILVRQDAKVAIGGKKYLIRAGSKFPFKKLEDGMVTFQAGDQEVTIGVEMVSFGGQSKETPEEITKLAKTELMRRYPAIGVKDSPENEMFVARINDLKTEFPDIFKNPRWPLEIGEQLAAQEGWTRADAPADDAASRPPAGRDDAPKLPPPGAPMPPADVPQEAPPPAK